MPVHACPPYNACHVAALLEGKGVRLHTTAVSAMHAITCSSAYLLEINLAIFVAVMVLDHAVYVDEITVEAFLFGGPRQVLF